MTLEEFKLKLEEKNIKIYDFVYQFYKGRYEKIPKSFYDELQVEEMYSERSLGSGDWDGWYYVIQVDNSFFLMICGYYSSEEGVDFYGESDVYLAELQEVTTKEWVALNPI